MIAAVTAAHITVGMLTGIAISVAWFETTARIRRRLHRRSRRWAG